MSVRTNRFASVRPTGIGEAIRMLRRERRGVRAYELLVRRLNEVTDGEKEVLLIEALSPERCWRYGQSYTKLVRSLLQRIRALLAEPSGTIQESCQ